MAYDFYLFDLDGTLSDPADGLVNTINYTLEFFGYKPQSKEKISPLIGIPIDQTYDVLLGDTRQHELRDLVAKYRERYLEEGFRENRIYDGIEDMLSGIKAFSIPIGICTTRREDIARKILDHLKMTELFSFISGGDVGVKKEEQIDELICKKMIPKKTLMVGDRGSDLIAAHKNRILSAGVLWGYGARNELEHENPAHIFLNPQEISELLK